MAENGRVALVSGGNRGIGLEVCRRLAGEGLTVVLGSRDEEKGRRAAEGLPGNVVARQLDVADAGSVERLASSIEEDFGRLDVLVNNAGISNDDGQSGAEADLDRVKEALEANLFGAWRLCEVAIPHMKREGYGRIVNVSTGLAALEDMGGGSPGYRISKTGLNALTRILAAELRGSGVLVNAVNPGWVATDMGGGSPGYRISKTGLNALTRILAAELRGNGILVNAVNPGWVATDMGGANANRTVEEGADGVVWAATLPNNGPTGGFFRDRRHVSW